MAMSQKSSQSTIAIIGTGYVGMASAIGFAEFGHTVIGYDILPDRIAKLQQGITPYREAGIEEMLARHLKTGGIRFVSKLEEAVLKADFIAIAVGTPSTQSGAADLSAVDEVMKKLAALPIDGKIIVLRSTVPPGTSDRLAEQLDARADFLFAPEFLREGAAVSDFMNPDRILVGGTTPESAQRYAKLFTGLTCPVLITSMRSAELAKGMANAFLALKISFANQVANLCDDVGADALDVLDAIGHDHRIGRLFLQPGIGFGGPCFEKDVKSLTRVSEQNGAHCDLLKATLQINDRQPKRIIEILEDELGQSVSGMEIGVWGLSFKGGTDDIRDSMAIRVVDELVARGAKVRAFDPSIERHRTQVPYPIAETAVDAARADALVVLTDWSEFANVDPKELAPILRRSLVVDGRNILNREAYTNAGLTYRGIGRRGTHARMLSLA
jgi:UDPglucose 6-dehydrogenase